MTQSLGLQQGPISVVLYDAHGIGSGASGAAAGILHPCSPKGKVVNNTNSVAVYDIRISDMYLK